ncbi:MAG: dodecin, partial [bacterium]
MQEKVYKKIEIVGVSEKSVSDAIAEAIKKTSETVRNLRWFEVTEIRGAIKSNKPVYQVVLKIG